MSGAFGFDSSEGCRNCKFRKDGFFCQFSTAAMSDLDLIASPATYPDRAVLFMEKQKARGVYILCQGEAKLSVSSSEGKTLILRIAKAGEILGLQAVLSGNPYEVTAETLRPCQAAFIRREELLRFMAQHSQAYENVVNQLTAQYQSTHEQLRTVGLSSSPLEKLAKLLLNWAQAGRQTTSGTAIALPLTHEEIGEHIGVSRETVTRALGDFKDRRLVTLQGATLMITNRAALERFVSF